MAPRRFAFSHAASAREDEHFSGGLRQSAEKIRFRQSQSMRGSRPAVSVTWSFPKLKNSLPSRPAVLVWAVLWMSVVLAGSGALWRHASSAGDSGNAPASWPAASTLARSANRKTLVMFAHPQCPCTRASIGELALLMARCGNGLDAYVVFFQPDGVAEDWTRTSSVGEAERIPGVKVVFDKSGREAELFGAATSGQTDFFDTDGRLLFSGGITAARGHAGDNAGRDAIVGWTSNGAADRTCTPVFGCAIAETPRATTNLTP
jgi:hypothetical protein